MGEQMLQQILGELKNLNQQVGNLNQQVGNLDQRVGNLDQRVGNLDQRVGNLDQGQARLEKSQNILATEIMSVKENLNSLAVRIENVIEPKINALFDGYKLHTEQLSRIEEQVSRHDEHILKKIK